MQARKGNLAAVMVAAIVERYGKSYALLKIIEHGDGVNASAKYQNAILL
jgi:hypothetical protein